MTQEAALSCRCGEVRGSVAAASPRTSNRLVCYCDDCQAYVHHLGRTDLLDANGGSEIIQVAPASLTFARGRERIAGVRLVPKGLYRWYATCCNTPVGNTVGPALPFVGILAQTFSGFPASLDGLFGPPVAAVMGKFAVGTPPANSTKLNLGFILRAVSLVASWRLSGKTWPHPFFDRATKSPVCPVAVLSPMEREALRPLCGPRAADGPAA